tara:strand:- start:14 stop:856 length:843 start_codon:yes stop_codon:yes gene_type:complete
MLSGLTAKTLGRYQDATEMIEKSMERLASGTADISSADKVKIGRINNTVHTLQTAHRVVKQNQDLLNTALAGTDAIKSVVVKMKELATQAQDDQITDTRRDQLVAEYNELQNEIDYVAKNTEYDGTELIDGSFGSKTITIDGANEDQDIDISLGNLTLSGLKIGSYENDIGGGNTETISASTLTSAANAADAVSRLESAIETLDSERANQISKIERFDFTISHMERMITINEEAIATINDFDEAAEMAKLTGYRIEQQTAIALMAQAQQLSAGVLQLLQG